MSYNDSLRAVELNGNIFAEIQRPKDICHQYILTFVWIRIRNKTTKVRIQSHSIFTLKAISKDTLEDVSPNHGHRYF